jgi:hypothetical protein
MTKRLSTLRRTLVGTVAVVLLAITPATALAGGGHGHGGGPLPTAPGCSAC